MAVRQANLKGVKFNDGPAGSNQGGVAEISFDLLGTVCTGGVDTVTIGGGGYDNGVATTSSLVTLLQGRRRDGKTIVLTGAAGALCAGYQGQTPIYPQAAAVSGSNVISITLNTAPSGGSSQSTTAAGWDKPCMLTLSYYTSNPF